MSNNFLSNLLHNLTKSNPTDNNLLHVASSTNQLINPPHDTLLTFKIDSGVSKHYLKETHTHNTSPPASLIRPKPAITLPNNSSVYATKES